MLVEFWMERPAHLQHGIARRPPDASAIGPTGPARALLLGASAVRWDGPRAGEGGLFVRCFHAPSECRRLAFKSYMVTRQADRLHPQCSGKRQAHVGYRLPCVAWQLIVRMRRFGTDLALNRENGGCWILKLTASVNKLSACALGRSGLLRRL